MDEKTELRKEMLGKRLGFDANEIAAASGKIMRNLFADFSFLKCASVGFYYPHKGEVDTHDMIERAESFGKEVYLPKIIDDEMIFCAFTDFDDLEKGKFEIMEPAGNEIGEPETLIVPGIAFDLEKHRLGFGKGFYDKYLHAHSVSKIGICYGWQVVGKLPRHGHDVQMDRIISEEWIVE